MLKQYINLVTRPFANINYYSENNQKVQKRWKGLFLNTGVFLFIYPIWWGLSTSYSVLRAFYFAPKQLLKWLNEETTFDLGRKR